MKIDRLERFLKYVNVHPGTACWNWAGGVSRGYGQFWNGTRTVPAHHVLLDSPVPKGKMACHKCDNRRCVRPSHIFIGTARDNVADCINKGRFKTGPNGRSGMLNSCAKLTDDAVRVIRATPMGKYVRSGLAARFGVSASTIASVRGGHTWNSVK
jgi:hypothetical protein